MVYKVVQRIYFFFYLGACILDSTCDESHSNPYAFVVLFCRGENALQMKWPQRKDDGTERLGFIGK